MLLSQENVLYHNENDKNRFNSYDRVLEFVDDQVKQHFKSKLMNQLNNEGNSSVSEYPTTATTNSSPTPSKARIPLVGVPVKTERVKNTKKNATHASTHTQLPQSKRHGLHLLEKFTSPNLVIDRVTHKQNLNRPSIGIFNKGKSSAKGNMKKGVEDLLFSESDFLYPRNQSAISSVSDRSVLSESPYFQRKTNQQLQASPPSPSSSPSSPIQKKRSKINSPIKKPYEVAKANKGPSQQHMSRNNNDNQEEDVTPLKRRRLVTNPSSPSILSKMSTIQCQDGQTEDHIKLYQARKKPSGNGSDHSNDTIKRLLLECQNAPQLENIKTNNHNSASDYIWHPSFSSSQIPPSQKRFRSNPENYYLPSEYNESTSSHYSPNTDRLTSIEHGLFHIDDANSDILSRLKTLDEEEDSLKNFWINQYTRRL